MRLLRLYASTMLAVLQTLHDEAYLLVVKATPTTHADPGTGSGVPHIVARTTLVLVRLVCASLCKILWGMVLLSKQ